jgi:hypothetical protein
MIELNCVTIDKENECTIEIELLVMELKLVSFRRPELGNAIQFELWIELNWIGNFIRNHWIQLNRIEKSFDRVELN